MADTEAQEPKNKVTQSGVRQRTDFIEEEVGKLHSGQKLASDIYQQGRERGLQMGSSLVARQLAREHHHSIAQGNLFDIIGEEAKGSAIVNQKNDTLLSSIVAGIDGGETAEKVIIALCQVLAEQSDWHPKQKSLKTMEDNGNALLQNVFGEHQLSRVIVAGELRNGMETIHDGRSGKDYPKSTCPVVAIKITDFTRRVMGLAGKAKVRPEDKNAVRGVIIQLKTKQLYTLTNGGWIWVTLIGKARGYINPTTKEETMVLELDSIFTKDLFRDFITLPTDILERLRGRQKKITMRLFWLLCEQRSCRKNSYPLEHVKKADLLSEIAIIDSYKKNLKRREDDFREAVEMMKKIRLIADYSESENKAKQVVCHFTFSQDF